jgi:hypothetical protein
VSRDAALFLAGRQPLYLNGRWNGYRHLSVAWGSVLQYIVFDSLDEYHSRVSRLPVQGKAAVRQ